MNKYINTYKVKTNQEKDGNLLEPQTYISGYNGITVYRNNNTVLNIYVASETYANDLCNLIWDALTEDCQNNILELRKIGELIPDEYIFTIYESKLSTIDDILLLEGMNPLRKPRNIKNLPRPNIPYFPKNKEKYEYIKEVIESVATAEANKDIPEGDNYIIPSDIEYDFINSLILKGLDIEDEYENYKNTPAGFGYGIIDYIDKIDRLDEAINVLKNS